MRSIASILLILTLFTSCSKEVRAKFSQAVMDEQYIDLEGEHVSLRNILSQYEGKQIVIDVWASWCRDCIIGLPKLNALQVEKPEAIYLFLSADRNVDSWKRAIEKYQIKGEHYFMPNGTKGILGKFVDIDWIPRYMIVNSKGEIELFEAIEANDERIKELLN
ncbi:TlpA disulfide reductase family protein [uncultured Psychroserpens sp.]|uniref:TlpA family protein disulfide reductase n=1 Tax=uncultured Psychroserpens sp. TaxID=255436 RepID=UPI00261E13E2|nr:TlpA disulfide reductase family protein [uncultured Psychroserpens sp.]